MASLFDTLFAEVARPALVAHLADTGVTYTPASTGVAVDVVTAIVGAEADELLELDEGRTRLRHRTVEISTAEADPKHPDVFTIDGEAWTVRERLGVQGGLARLRVVRPERVEHAGRRALR